MQDRFLPDFLGCVSKDGRMARAVERLWREELEAVSVYLYREVLLLEAETALSELFEELAREAAYHFRFLGGLLSALGSDLSLRTQIRLQCGMPKGDESRRSQNLLYDSLREKRRLCALYRSVIEGCADGVVRAVLSCFLEDHEGSEERINRFFG